MFLHAARIELTHPASGETLALEAPLPAELAGFLDVLTAAAATSGAAKA
jgi:23S rRNA pseudouridine955/2504/2580 synthase